MALTHDQPADTSPRFIRLPEVLRRCGLGKTKIYALIGDGEFPKPTKIGRAALWRSDVITKWLDKNSVSA